MIFLALAGQQGEICFESEYTKAHFKEWLKNNQGKPFRIDTDQKVSVDLRGYYFGAVIPELRKTCVQWEKLSSDELHQVIKKMLFYFEAWNPLTNRTERYGRSVMADSDWNNTRKAMKFLDDVGEYLVGAGREMPDSKAYKEWKDSAPSVGEKYETVD